MGAAELYQVDPFAPSNGTTLIHTFPEATALFGIAELSRGNYAVIASLFNSTSLSGTNWTVWSVELQRNTAAEVSKIADVPDAGFLNGMTALNNHTLLIADSANGTVIKLDTRNGTYETAIDDASMKILPGAPLPVGINGLKLHREYLYYTSSTQGSVNRVKVDKEGYASGPIETISNSTTLVDELVVARDGSAIVARPLGNDVARFSLDGTHEILAGGLNSSDVAGAVSVTLGRTKKDRNVVYVSTNGGIAAPVNGTFTEGGKVVAITLQ
ncbi:hypothetical protein BU24DRAFT_420039 [Aaosphaeria arxii CBS 175.79]|uniref:Uncharacterized protein n=1 Tax=Aaosphaeria arxii CBS 175.79 TaxID=1450172 RepID=A0A6A5XUW5_9PLEO|nr:uncharacterized protein BU24DRAFT_420039 [Aaosphaeria arxii CBS 175.79]KAF2017012.1 hypothetical protein BU24DRAFT_420039 [Aaosphaeria arxii CBS 175.79]